MSKSWCSWLPPQAESLFPSHPKFHVDVSFFALVAAKEPRTVALQNQKINYNKATYKILKPIKLTYQFYKIIS